MNFEKTCFGFVGLGLIGGSIAKAIKRLNPKARIIAYNRTQTVLEQACAENIVDVACKDVDAHFSECDYIFLCLPVSYNVAFLSKLSGLMHKNCILTDVGSVKTDIHKHIKDLGLENYFIGGHPMAGSDQTGYAHATDHLLTNAYYILTPTEHSSQAALDQYYNFVRQLGALPIVLGYEEHDYMTAHISHVPHILASGLANLVQNADNSQQIMRTIAAGGFKDTTRIASSSPIMWQQICQTNRKNVCQVLDSYIELLQQIRKQIMDGSSEEIYQFFEKAQQYRKTFD